MGREGAAPARGGKFARCVPPGRGRRRSPGRGGAREARPGRARERKVPSGTRARAGIRAANEARVWAVRGWGTGRSAAFAVAAAGAVAASRAGGEAAADRRAGRAPRPGPGVENRTAELETFPAGNSRRPGAAAGLPCVPGRVSCSGAEGRRGSRRGGEGDGESGKACGKVSGACLPRQPPLAGHTRSFPGIGLDMLGARALVLPALESAPSFRGPVRAGPSRSGQNWGAGAPGTRGSTLEFRDHPRPARLLAPFPSSCVARGLGKGSGRAWYLGQGKRREARLAPRGPGRPRSVWALGS